MENNLSNSIIGTCIASGHLNLFITFIQQSIDINLGKLHRLSQTNLSSENKMNETWKWKYIKTKKSKDANEYSLIYLIIQSNWQGALSLILNEIDRFHLNYIQILEGAILNNKLNLVLRLLFRLKDEFTFDETNSHQQNLYHLLANINQYDENLLKQILLFLFDYKFQWNTSDQYGSYPLHYACVKQNFVFIQFVYEKYPNQFNLNQIDQFGNTPIGLLFWSLGSKTSFANDKLRLIISSENYLNCLCNYDNEIVCDPLSFHYTRTEEISSYPSIKSNVLRTSPLIHAIVHNNFQLVQFLLELKADVNFTDENKQTPLMYAIRQVRF
jgi:ankyrin repeat protein